MTQKLLICEDEADLRALLEITLQREGFVVRGSSDGQEFMALFEEDPPDLVLLDVMLPDVTGVELCRRIRKHPQHNDVPVILLTARNDEIDRVVGLAVGADDYVGKPFSVRELVMRVRAVLRRSQKETPAPAPEVGRIRVDVEGHRAWVDGQLLDLTAVELKLLNLFVSKPGRALTRDAILAGTWGADHHVTERAVDTHVKRLRQKLGPAGDAIETLRGIGYRYTSGT